MYPVVFPPAGLNVVLAGAGQAAARRLDGLEAAGATVRVFSPGRDDALVGPAGDRLTQRLPEAADLTGARLMLVAGLDDEGSERLAALARAAGVPVNVEDRPALCDFHIPAVVRRGDLLITVSTGGTAPGLAARLRRRLEALFGPEWGERLAALSKARAEWRAEGADMATLRRRTREWLDRQGWFD
jgi:precorrin-2 dehydrogenase/sirohydrochlorin ferrochelatase